MKVIRLLLSMLFGLSAIVLLCEGARVSVPAAILGLCAALLAMLAGFLLGLNPGLTFCIHVGVINGLAPRCPDAQSAEKRGRELAVSTA